MVGDDIKLLGVGIYSVAEAARLTNVAPARIRRWIKGYAFKGARGDTHKSPPVWRGQHPIVDGEVALGFLDLLEIRFVDAFLRSGVRWPTIRLAEQHASELFKTDHPFATNRFKTDGRSIFVQIKDESGDKALVDIARNQYAFQEVVAPCFIGLEFSDEQAIRWWPLGLKRRIVLDPTRCFGQPIVSKEGVPTRILALAYEAEQSEVAVARWYRVDQRSVRDAVEFEKKLAA